jgi:hypothetical protein
LAQWSALMEAPGVQTPVLAGLVAPKPVLQPGLVQPLELELQPGLVK